MWLPRPVLWLASRKDEREERASEDRGLFFSTSTPQGPIKYPPTGTSAQGLFPRKTWPLWERMELNHKVSSWGLQAALGSLSL